MAIFAAFAASLGRKLGVFGEAAIFRLDALTALARDFALLVIIHRREAAIGGALALRGA